MTTKKKTTAIDKATMTVDRAMCFVDECHRHAEYDVKPVDGDGHSLTCAHHILAAIGLFDGDVTISMV